MFCTNDTTGGFHTKGYIFREQEIYKIIIGSSNMTLSAITKNREWNTKIVSASQGKMANEILEECDIEIDKGYIKEVIYRCGR